MAQIIRGDDSRFEFGTNVKDIVVALSNQIDYRNHRVEYWLAEKEAATALLNASITTKSEPVTGGERIVAQLNEQHGRRVIECDAKLANHRGKLRRLNLLHGAWNNVDTSHEVYLTLAQLEDLGVYWNESLEG